MERIEAEKARRKQDQSGKLQRDEKGRFRPVVGEARQDPTLVGILPTSFSLLELAERLGIDYGTLANYQTVAKAYELSNRFESLTFKHHMIAAPLEDKRNLANARERHYGSLKELAERLGIHSAVVADRRLAYT